MERRQNEAGIFGALSDPTRRAILRELRESSLTAGDIAQRFHQSGPTISHHLKALRLAGLVRTERRGTSIVYTLQANVLEEIATELFELVGKKRKVAVR